MKKLLLLFFATIFSISIQAQTEDEARGLLDQYADIFESKEWSRSLDLTYPDLFNVIPRDQMEQVIESTFNSPLFEMSFGDLEVQDVSELYEEEGLSYRFMNYRQEMAMTVLDTEAVSVSALIGPMRAQFGEENVTVSGSTLNILANNKLAVLKKTGDEKLYGLEIKNELKSLMGNFMSETFVRRAFE